MWQEERFASAEGFDAATGRYQGPRCGEPITVSADGTGLLVKPDVASRQLDADRACIPDDPDDPSDHSTGVGPGTTGVCHGGTKGDPVAVDTRKARRFHGMVAVDTLRPSRDVGQITQDVIQHLSGLVVSQVELTLEID